LAETAEQAVEMEQQVPLIKAVEVEVATIMAAKVVQVLLL
jgi:hypothetical protein